MLATNKLWHYYGTALSCMQLEVPMDIPLHKCPELSMYCCGDSIHAVGVKNIIRIPRFCGGKKFTLYFDAPSKGDSVNIRLLLHSDMLFPEVLPYFFSD